MSRRNYSSHLHSGLKFVEVTLVVVRKFIISSRFYDLSIVQDEENLAVANGAESVSNHD